MRLQRKRLLDDCELDEGLRAEILLACRRSPEFFINGFCWTKRQRSQDESGMTVLSEEAEIDMPFVLWACQAEALQAFAEYLPFAAGDRGRGGNLVIDKGREMGATWLVIAYMLHQWLFIKGRNFILLSRKEELVDMRYNVDSLFGKLDYLLSFLPAWMRPDINRAENRLANLINNNLFQGESTSKYAGQSQRAAAALVDEAAKIENLEEISRNLGETVVTQFLVSTPDKRGIAFTKIRNNPATKLVVLHWSRHPEKAIGREIVDGKWTSPWYRNQQIIWAHDPKYVAINHDIDHTAAGDMFFDSVVIQNHRAMFMADPVVRGELVIEDGAKLSHCLRKRDPRMLKFVPLESGRWSLWFNPADTGGRPPQNDLYVAGCDIGMGVGAANSAIQMGSRELMRQVGIFVASGTLPEDLAREMLKAGVWFGGDSKPTLLAWEANGYGEVFGRIIMKYLWPFVYKRIVKDQRSEQKTKKLGWWNSSTSVLTVLEQARQMIGSSGIIVPDDLTLRECEDYMHFDDGTVGPAGFAEIPERARKNHGDRVIALCIMIEAMIRAPRFKVDGSHVEFDKKGRKMKINPFKKPDEQEASLAGWE